MPSIYFSTALHCQTLRFNESHLSKTEKSLLACACGLQSTTLVDVLALEEYLFPQTRVRVFLRGLRRNVAESMPPVLPPLGKPSLARFLGKFPNVCRTSFTPHMKLNIVTYEEKIRDMVTRGKLELTDLCTIALDRSAEGVFNQRLVRNSAPTLTCNNSYVFVIEWGAPDRIQRICGTCSSSRRVDAPSPACATACRPCLEVRAPCLGSLIV
jgi:hypothetical protein